MIEGPEYAAGKKEQDEKGGERHEGAEVDRAVLHILTVLRVPPVLAKPSSPSFRVFQIFLWPSLPGHIYILVSKNVPVTCTGTTNAIKATRSLRP